MYNTYNQDFKNTNMNLIPKNSFSVLGDDGNYYLTPQNLHNVNSDLNITDSHQKRNGIPCNNYQKPHILHNNIKEDVMTEEVYEEPLYIDSIDRNSDVFKNPFNYRVIFNPTPDTVQPYVVEYIKNIRYLRLEVSILPRYYQLKKTTVAQSGDIFNIIDNKLTNSSTDSFIESLINTSETIGSDIITYVNIEYTRDPNTSLLTKWIIEFIINGNTEVLYSYTNDDSSVTYINYEYNTDIDLAQERYLTMNIEELNHINDRSTSNNIIKSFAVLYRDIISDKFVQFVTRDVIKTYPYADLQNIKKLSITFRDGCGRLLTPSLLNYNIDTDNKCICIIDNDGELITNYQCACNYIRHPHYTNLQNHTLIKLGLLHPNISKKVYC